MNHIKKNIINPVNVRWREIVFHRVALVLFLLISIFYQQDLFAQDVSEYRIKAAFLYKFANFVEWPEGVFIDDTSPLVFGVLGADRLADNLERIVTGRMVKGRSIVVRRLRPGDQVAGLHVLFIGGAELAASDSILSDASLNSVLTVTETPDNRLPDSVINFEIIDNKVKFDVSLFPAEQGGLKISSRLLQVAYRVIDNTL